MGGNGSLLCTCRLCLEPSHEELFGRSLSHTKDADAGNGRFCAYAVSSSRGWRPSMEDAHIAIPDFTPQMGLFVVLDGHGGKGVALLVARILPDILKSQYAFTSNPPNYAAALTHAFYEVDNYLRTPHGGLEALQLDHPREGEYEFFRKRLAYGENDSHPSMHMGSTCVLALVFRHKVIVANIGDSRCILSARRQDQGQPTVLCKPMSMDHKPINAEEERRIINSGGFLVRDMLGGYRINGGLNVSRGFGDFGYKDFADKPSECLVSVTPEILEYTFDNMHNICIVLCCDGIWDRKSSEEVAQFVQINLTDSRDMPKELSKIASKLIDESTCTREEKYSFDPKIRFTGQDNMTVVLARVCGPSC